MMIDPLKTGGPLKRVTGKQCRLQNVASDQGLHCLQIVQPFFYRNIYIIKPDIPVTENELFQYIVGRVYSVFYGLNNHLGCRITLQMLLS